MRHARRGATRCAAQHSAAQRSIARASGTCTTQVCVVCTPRDALRQHGTRHTTHTCKCLFSLRVPPAPCADTSDGVLLLCLAAPASFLWRVVRAAFVRCLPCTARQLMCGRWHEARQARRYWGFFSTDVPPRLGTKGAPDLGEWWHCARWLRRWYPHLFLCALRPSPLPPVTGRPPATIVVSTLLFGVPSLFL